MTSSVFMPGDFCDRYRVVRLLGTSREAELYQATQEFIERDVALKTWPLRCSGSRELQRRLLAGARSLGKIQHPNVLTVYDAGVTSAGIPFVAMPLPRGRTLRDALRALGPIPITQALQVAALTADGLGAAHALGIVHCELDAEHVLLLEHRTLKVANFGAGKAFRDPHFSAAPEQVAHGPITPRSDVYALGVILLEMLCGPHGFPKPKPGEPGLGELVPELLRADLTRPQLPTSVRNSISDLLVTALASAPSCRHASMSDFARHARRIQAQILAVLRRRGATPITPDLWGEPASLARAYIDAG
jgi:eukaryotic-like serine/threonine-protein kinase